MMTGTTNILPGDDDTDTTMLPLRVTRKQRIATDVFLFELVDERGAPLPSFSAGSHVTVLTPNGLTRRYSLCNGPAETGGWRIAVKRDANGLGGSVSMADEVQVGHRLPTSRPANHFALGDSADTYLLIAGGIGITPIRSMALELQRRGADFQLVYAARDAAGAAFRDELREALGPRLRLHLGQDAAAPGRLDVDTLLADAAHGRHVYCCGPGRLVQAVHAATRHWPSGQVFFEDFGSRSGHAPATGDATDRPFSVRLLRSGLTVEVPCGVSILEALRGHAVSVPSSCESGTCGSCRTPLVDGVADHRDYVLDDDEQATQIMVCVSRARSAELVIDL